MHLHRSLLLAVATVAAAIAGPTGAAADPDPPAVVRASVVSDELAVTNVVPTWGAQIPKVVYDGHFYYATTLDGDGAQYPWSAQVWRSRDGAGWTPVLRLPGHVYQPAGLLVDGEGDLHLQVACYTGAECYPGVAPAPGGELAAVYPVRLEFTERNADGSVDFADFTDHTIRAAGSERYYQGLAVDPSGRYLYSAYAVDGWDLWINVFDTVTGADVHTSKVASPPAGRAWLYPRVQPGTAPSEVSLTFSQYVLGGPNSAYLDAALLFSSDDGGRTFGHQEVLTSNPAPDGDGNWVDASDLTVGPDGDVHTVFYRRDGGVGTLYYQRGLDGDQVPVGPLDNHSQILVAPDGRISVFSSEGAALAVATSADGVDWTIERHTVPGVAAALWPNLLGARQGSRVPPGFGGRRPTVGMLMAGQTSGDAAFHPLLFVRYKD
ncbi:hypothetical protein [Jiangella anatolica]|uniref:Uncharacterized protein n=1 Tax=Jiangella anatolica TaxID=2670374 RepID=A0A2W2B9L8_9ACTN|nr:hypothetical protein [Jiangella anatolica]PZF84251.1 hypothetical protein C1I92_09400 [Jiangella anatolica]